MALKFQEIPRIFKDMPLWGCAKGDFTFVISKPTDESDIYLATVKRLGAVPFDNTREDLGQFPTFTEAECACNNFYRKRNN